MAIAGLTYGTISWNVVQLIADSVGDVDALPDVSAITGSVTITANTNGPLLAPTTSPPVTIYSGPYVFNVANGVLVDGQGDVQVSLLATDCPVVSPTNFTYTASFVLVGKVRGSFSFSLPTNTNVDLTTVTPVASSTGTPITQGPSGTITVGTTSLVSSNTPPSVVNRGTSSAAILDFNFPAPGGLFNGTTVDSGTPYKIIAFDNGTLRAIPTNSFPPQTPANLAAVPTVNSVKLSWSASTGAVHYNLYRDNALLTTTTSLTYQDRTVTTGQTYAYRVSCADQYGQLSPWTVNPVSAFVDPALNSPPTVSVTTWPLVPITGGITIVRVCGIDIDGQTLAYTLGTDTGTLTATADPSVWLLTL